ncbi:hypothetical protein CANTEDRAFT_126964 [Yamadazyma tenuis ATCC 10573]|uniref:Calcipressin n=1 Tax=Candida tenuis (strain ATCC 10573 / BCRC 21748 / CBS 615 / JCM 9827 / NBRC 10315 / NRRL Y-1498 / VKM Y-70) TaxID=590646 RepID=G3BBW2_CANTC|nr:uncharacterized protein CANTEDRAFT_126964 [Yamadazyma tenuis ATCC 10573]EGV60094.1 hypothetical protein CANTEDRAFT_126964 [Yamadazyma tenuis ATCC 10573]
MVRFPTNTLIITQVSDAFLDDPNELVKFLASHNITCELVSLRRFGRILLICDDHQVSQSIRQLLQNSPQWSHLAVTFSLQDNELTSGREVSEKMDYLELPAQDGSRRFLISPPLSPPPEWDHWDKVEEGPHRTAMTNPEELSHLLWERLGGVNSTEVRRFQAEDTRDLKIEPQVVFEDIDNDVPAILLDRVDYEQPSGPSKPVFKTSLPPPLP